MNQQVSNESPRPPVGDPLGMFPSCDHCGSLKVAPDQKSLSNLVRIPLAILIRRFTNIDVVDVRYYCSSCGNKFLTSLPSLFP